MPRGNSGNSEGPWHQLEHSVSVGAGHDLEFWKPGLSVCLSGFGGLTSFLTPEVLLYTLHGHFQLGGGKAGDGMFLLSFTLPQGNFPS